jgi:hypothetical protein
MALTYNTTPTYRWGTTPVTLTTGPQIGNTFITDEFTTTEPTWLAERKDNVGNPNGALGGIDPITGRATLQVANANVNAPQRFDEFTANLRTGVQNTFFLTEVSQPKRQRDFDVIEITFREKV